MAHRHALASAFAAAVLLGGGWTPASAQCRLCANPTTGPESDGETGQAIRLEAEAALDFDRLVLLGQGDGVVTLLPNGEQSTSTGVAGVSARAMVGSVTIHGEPGRTVRVDLPARIELYSLSGGSITVERIETDLPALPRLDSGGNLTFRFGGSLEIRGDSEGEYRGDIPINVEYL